MSQGEGKSTSHNSDRKANAPVAIKVDAAPSVSLTAPANNAVYAAPANVALAATATDAVGTITKVDFYQGATLIGTVTAAPYTFNWANVAAGSYSLTAVATNDAGTATTSAPVTITVDAAPVVSLTAPSSNAVYAAPGNVSLSAAATDSTGTIAKVDFYQGTTLIGTATTAPYTFNWTSVPAGSYSLSAVATNDAGMATTSAAVAITVDAPPTASLTAPASNSVYAEPASIALAATATDAFGTIAKVDFYQGTTLIGTVTASPYTFNWTGVAAGSYSLTAVATNDAGTATTSAAVAIVVDAAPSVSISSPANSASFTAPATIAITASAADTFGAVTKVDFYQGTTLIGTVTASPYSFTWTNVPVGSYSLTAVATNDAGATTTSIAISITVASGVAQMYFIQTDQLNTPRLIADQAGNTVWRNDNTEPFGDSVPNDDPNSTGNHFDFPLGLSLYYRDRETGTFYAQRRDAYDAVTGRFWQSDPIGLRGGVNTYAYVNGNPLSLTDLLGLAYFAKRPLRGMPWLGPFSCNSLDDYFNTEISHEQLFFEDGKSPSNLGFFDDGTLKEEPTPTGYRCKSGHYNDCIMRKAVAGSPPPPSYCVIGRNCQTWAEQVRKEYSRLAKDPQVQKECGACPQ